jgi:hypothetical protein|tara:strand:+ start:472 stop:738 length:267 start_codon:yes stop_codon:yes gene_type:complete
MTATDISLNVPGWYCKGNNATRTVGVVLEGWFEDGATDILDKINPIIFRLVGEPIQNFQAINNSDWVAYEMKTTSDFVEKGIYWIQVF